MSDGTQCHNCDKPKKSKGRKRMPFSSPAPEPKRVTSKRRGTDSTTVSMATAAPHPRSDLLHLNKDSVFRPPEYRWHLATRLAVGQFVPAEWSDPWVLLAAKVLAPSPNSTATPELRAVEAARRLAEHGAYWQKVEIEARLLAGKAAEAIAAKAGLAAATVEAYEALFFSVTDRLRHPGYMVHIVIRLHALGNETDVGAHVRMLGYKGGSQLLDVVLAALIGPRTNDANEESAETQRLRKLTRLALGLRTTPVTEENAGMWVRLFFLMQECRRRGVKLG